MKGFLAFLLMVCVLLSLCACGAQKAEPTEAPTEVPTQAPTEVPTEAVAEQPEGITYYVTVVDEGGMPVSGVEVQIDAEGSNPCITDEMGVATFLLPEGSYTVSVLELPMDYSYVNEAREFPFEEGTTYLTITLQLMTMDLDDLGGFEDEVPEEDVSTEDVAPEG